MPLYEYECKKCGHRFEKLVSFSNASKNQPCPSCKSEESEKLMSTFSTSSVSPSKPCAGSGGKGFS